MWSDRSSRWRPARGSPSTSPSVATSRSRSRPTPSACSTFVLYLPLAYEAVAADRSISVAGVAERMPGAGAIARARGAAGQLGAWEDEGSRTAEAEAPDEAVPDDRSSLGPDDRIVLI